MFEFDDAEEQGKKKRTAAPKRQWKSYFGSHRRIGSDSIHEKVQEVTEERRRDDGPLDDSALYAALFDENWEECRRLLSSESKENVILLVSYVNEKDGNGPLHEACYRNAPLDVVESVCGVGGGRTMTTVNGNGSTPLHVACQYASEEVVLFMLDAAPQAAEMEDDGGELPLHEAVRFERETSVIKRLFATNPTAAYAANSQGSTPLEWIVNKLGRWDKDMCLDDFDGINQEMMNQTTPQCDVNQCACTIS